MTAWKNTWCGLGSVCPCGSTLTSQGDVISVHVDDTAIDGPVAFSTYAGGEVNADLQRIAADVTRDDTAWPAWTIGFGHT